MYATLFNLAGLAIAGWALLILLPTWRVTRKLADRALFPLALALIYVVGIVVLLSGTGLGVINEFGTAEGVIGLLATPDVALVAWIHILAFDHFVGVLIYRDNMRHRVVPIPVQSVILFLTLMFGPVGFVTYYALRALRRRSLFEGDVAPERSSAPAAAPAAAEPAVATVRDVPRPPGSLPASFARTVVLLWSHERRLAMVGALGVAIAAAMGLAALVRGNAVLPEGNLFETATFDAAVGIFVLTLAALSPLAAFTPRGRKRWVGWFSAFVLIAYAIETVQAFRGLDPRFSAVAGPADQLLGLFFFLIAQGVMICAFILLWKFFRPATAHLPHALRLAVRYGAAASVVAFGVGEAMSALNGRFVGEAGNLLPLHAAGFHGVQAIPVVALLLVWAGVTSAVAIRATHAAGIAWLIACAAIAVQSFGGLAMFDASAMSLLALAALATWAVVVGWAVVQVRGAPAGAYAHPA